MSEITILLLKPLDLLTDAPEVFLIEKTTCRHGFTYWTSFAGRNTQIVFSAKKQTLDRSSTSISFKKCRLHKRHDDILTICTATKHLQAVNGPIHLHFCKRRLQKKISLKALPHIAVIYDLGSFFTNRFSHGMFSPSSKSIFSVLFLQINVLM